MPIYHIAESIAQLCLMITEGMCRMYSVTSGKLSLVMGGVSDSVRSVKLLYQLQSSDKVPFTFKTTTVFWLL